MNMIQKASENFNKFKKQSANQISQMIKIQELSNQINKLQQYKRLYTAPSIGRLIAPNELFQINRYINIYKAVIKQIQRLKKQHAKQRVVRDRIQEIFKQQIQQLTNRSQFQKSSAIRTQDVQLPSFKSKKGLAKQNVINIKQQNSYHSPELRKFFQKKQTEINNKSMNKTNFKDILKSQQPNNKINPTSMLSVQQPSRVSRSSTSSVFKRRSNIQQQLKKISQQNKRVREQYQRKLKRQNELNQFQKKLLKQEKNRYMMKIEQLQMQLENLHRENYKIKQEEQISRLKEIKDIDKYSQLGDVNENVLGAGKAPDYYQPYVMNTKHNDLKKLMEKKNNSINKQEQKNNDVININVLNKQPQNYNNSQKKLFSIFHKNQGKKISQYSDIDQLGNELEKQIKFLQKQRDKSQNSSVYQKKWTQPYNEQIKNKNNLSKVIKQINGNHNPKSYQQLGYQKTNKKKLDQTQQQDNQILKDLQIMQANSNSNINYNHKNSNINIIAPTQYMNQSNNSLNQNYHHPKSNISQVNYIPQPNFSFTKNKNQLNQYSLTSTNGNRFDTFQMTKTFLDLQQGQQSLANKYIDSKTSTRNKVAFFKDSLILIKNDKFDLAYKKSTLIQSTKDRCRIIFFIKNNTKYPIKVKFNYEYDASYFKLKVHQKIMTINPQSQSKQDIQIYHYSQNDLNQVIDILIQIDGQKYGLWMPITWIQFQQKQDFKMPHYNQEIQVLPDRQFKSYQTAKQILPLMYGGKDGIYEWAYMYGKSKFGSCYVKLTWQGKQLKIQSNAKWIDLLAFIMHHVK